MRAPAGHVAQRVTLKPDCREAHSGESQRRDAHHDRPAGATARHGERDTDHDDERATRLDWEYE